MTGGAGFAGKAGASVRRFATAMASGLVVEPEPHADQPLQAAEA